MAREAVKLNVYDMASINQYTSRLGVGVFHSGIEVYGTEYGYGGHPYDFTGIFEIEPRDEESLGEDIFKYRETIILGETDFTDNEIRQLVESIGHLFKGIHYHLLHQNCNHFCDHLAKTLCGQGLPNWVNRLAYISTCVPFLEKCLPREFLTPIALEQDIRLHVQQAGGCCSTPDQRTNDLNNPSGCTNSTHPNCILMNKTNNANGSATSKEGDNLGSNIKCTKPSSSAVLNAIEVTSNGSSSNSSGSSSKAATASKLLFNSFCSKSRPSNCKSKVDESSESGATSSKVSSKAMVTKTSSDASDETNSSFVNEESSDTNERKSGGESFKREKEGSFLNHRKTSNSFVKKNSSS